MERRSLIRTPGLYAYIFAVSIPCYFMDSLAQSPISTNISADGTLNTIVETGANGTIKIDGGTYSDPTRGGRANQFHSFGSFTVGTGKTAQFNATVNRPNSVTTIDNVVARVTGGSQSLIDGTIAVNKDNLSGANLVLVNPAGVMFTQNASLDVPGSFTATTADFLRMGEDGIFYAASDKLGETVLSSSPISAFGFLNPEPAGISIKGSTKWVNLSREGGARGWVFVGGDLVVQKASLFSATSVQLTSVASEGEVLVSNGAMNIDATAKGNITLTDRANIGSGHVIVRGGVLTVEGSGSVLEANGDVGFPGAGIDISVDELVVKNFARIKSVSSELATMPIKIQTSELRFEDHGYIETDSVSSDTAVRTGDITIESPGDLTIRGVPREGDASSPPHGLISTNPSASDSPSGDIMIKGDHGSLLVDGVRVETSTGGLGAAGNISFNAGHSLTIQGRASLEAISIDAGAAGGITLSGRDVLVSASTVTAQAGNFLAEDGSIGAAGQVTINGVNSLTLDNGAQIIAATLSKGDGGNVEITSPVLFVGGGSGITTYTQGSGHAGDIVIHADDIEIDSGTLYSGAAPDLVSNLDPDFSVISTGDGGDVTIAGRGGAGTSSQRLSVTDGVIAAIGVRGRSGNITLSANTVALERSGITSTVLLGDQSAGDITFNVGELEAKDAIVSSRSAEDADGTAGRVVIQGQGERGTAAKRVAWTGTFTGVSLVDTGPKSSLNTTAQRGEGGSISVSADEITFTDAVVSASVSGSGLGGDVMLRSPSITLVGTEVSAEAGGTAQAGSVLLEAGRLVARDGSRVSSRSTATGNDAGKAGSVDIRGLLGDGSPSQLVTINDSEITSEAVEGGGGFIGLRGDRIELMGSKVSSTVKGGSEPGGFIEVQTPELLMHSSSIQSKSEGAGKAGNIALRVGTATVTEGSEISSSATTTGSAGSVAIEGIAEDASLAQEVTIQNSSVTTEADRGKSGSIGLGADRIELTGATVSATVERGSKEGGFIEIQTPELLMTNSSIQSKSGGSGNAGNMIVQVGTATVKGDSEISSSATATGRAGSVTVQGLGAENSLAQRVTIRNSEVTTEAVEGRGGSVGLGADQVELDGATVSATVKGGSQEGGFIEIRTPELLMTNSSIQSKSEGAGTAGNMILRVGTATVKGGSEISSSATATGRAGSVTIQGLGDENSLAQHIAIENSEVTTEAFEGEGGSIGLGADQLGLDGASISSTVLGGEKTAGNIEVKAGNLTLVNQAEIASESQGSGAAGNINIKFADTFLTRNSMVSTDAIQSDGGNIIIDGGRMLRLRNDSAITTSVTSGDSTGGNIDIQSRFVILDSSTILANAFGGPGGTIRIEAEAYIPSGDSLVEAVGKASQIPGTIEILAPDTDFLKSLAPLTAVFEDPGSRLGDRCSQRRDVDQSTFSTAVRDGMPLGPEAYLLGAGMTSELSELDERSLNWEQLEINPELFAQAGLVSVPCR